MHPISLSIPLFLQLIVLGSQQRKDPSFASLAPCLTISFSEQRASHMENPLMVLIIMYKNKLPYFTAYNHSRT